MRRIIIGLVFITVGVLWGLQNYGIIDLNWNWHIEWHKVLFPAIFILIGLRIALGMSKKNRCDNLHDAVYTESSEGDIPKLSVAFSGNRYILNGQKFVGAKIDTFCGGMTIDLYGAEIADNCVMDIHTFMGGVDIKAPDDINFIISSNGFLGGVDNQRYTSNNASKTIMIKANCLLGGVSIKK